MIVNLFGQIGGGRARDSLVAGYSDSARSRLTYFAAALDAGEVRMGEKSPGSPATADGLETNEKVDDEEMRDDTERTAAAEAAAKEEAVKVAAEAAAREEETRLRAEAEVEARRRADDQARAARERIPRRMGALQVRGSPEDAEEIYWMLSEGEEPAEWGKVLYNDKTNQQSHRTKFRGWRMTNAVTVAFWAAEKDGWVRYGDACYRINALGGDRRVEQTTSHKQGATWSRATAPAWAPEQESFEWGPDGVRCTTGTPRATYAQAAGRDEAGADVAAVLEALKQS